MSIVEVNTGIHPAFPAGDLLCKAGLSTHSLQQAMSCIYVSRKNGRMSMMVMGMPVSKRLMGCIFPSAILMEYRLWCDMMYPEATLVKFMFILLT